MFLVRVISLLLFMAGLAHGQSSGGFVPGQTLTAAQLNTALQRKTDWPFLGPYVGPVGSPGVSISGTPSAGYAPIATGSATAVWGPVAASSLGGVTFSGTPAVGYVPVATGTTTAVWGNQLALNITSGCPASPGVRAPFYICNNNNGTSAAGYALGWQVFVGGSPGADIAANDAVATFVKIDNLNGRQATWANNTVCQQQTVASGGSAQIVHCSETDVIASIAVTVPTSAYTMGPAVHGAEYFSSQNTGTVIAPQVAVYVNSASDVGATQAWWQFGFSCARVNLACVVGEINPNGASDSTAAFTSGFIWDKSHSQAVIKDSGVHTSFIDLFDGPTLTYFVRGYNSAATNLVYANSANFKYNLSCQAGASADQECGWVFNAFGGTPLWKLDKNSSNNMEMVNVATGNAIMVWENNDTVVIGRGGNPVTIAPGGALTVSTTVNIGGIPASAGSGGLYVCIDSAGNTYKKSACP